MQPIHPEPRWKINWIKPRIEWMKQVIRPAEISDGLSRVMLARENILEDANYTKVLPNHFIVELSPANYRTHFEPLAGSLVQQWRDRLVESLMIANSRQGRKEYRFAGQVRIEIRVAEDVKDNQARVLSRIEANFHTADRPAGLKAIDRNAVAYLELVNEDRHWPLYPGDNTIGRSASCTIVLDMPLVQEKRLVSSQHALIRVDGRQCYLYDGVLPGKPSVNGTFINSQRISEYGAPLQDGDIIILASLDPNHPRWDTPGAAVLRFRMAA